MTTSPPDHIIASALAYARQSPCCKSKRGVAIFDPSTPHAAAIALGTNHPPLPQGCDGSDACREDCARRCIHAEADGLAMFAALYGASSALDQLGIGGGMRIHPTRSELVHVKIGPAGELVAGGGPSCWQCSRNVLEVGIAAVWLYQVDPVDYSEKTHCPTLRLPFASCMLCQNQACGVHGDAACACAVDERHRNVPAADVGRWHRYTGEEFHRVTCRNAKGGPVYLCP